MNRTSSSIHHQLQLFFVLTLGFAVLVMGGAWISYNQLLLEREAERVLTVEADIIGAAARPAVMFNDGRLANELMKSMNFDRDISVVKLFTSDGKTLFTYGISEMAAADAGLVGFQAVAGTAYIDGRLQLYRVISHKNRPVGVIYLESQLQHLQESRSTGIKTVLLAMGGCLVLALLLASRLQRKIAAPISALATLMHRMGVSRDYSLRIRQPAYNTETDALLAGFNSMAEEIQNSFAMIEENQAHLQQSESRFRSIVEMAPLPVIVTRPADGHVLFYNLEVAKLFGVAPNAVDEFDALSFYRYPEDRARLMQMLKNDGELHGQEVEVVNRDGKPFWITLSISMMDYQGEMALFSAFMDITGQKNIELLLEQRVQRRTAELQSAKNELQSTLDNMMDTYYRIDADGEVDWVSASIQELLGYAPSEITGISLQTLSTDGAGFPVIAEALRQHNGAVINQKVQLKHRSGHGIWASVSAHLIMDENGEIFGVEGVARDISQLVEAEAQKQEMQQQITHMQRLESLGVLAGGIAHDFNNILAAIMGNAELAQMNAIDGEPVRAELKNIIAGSGRAAELCSQMLAYSGQGQFIKQDVNITGLVEEALQLIDVSIPKNISLQLALSEALPMVNADKTQIEQIIMNLVSNAAESIGSEKEGEIRLLTDSVQADAAMLKCKLIEDKRKPGDYVSLVVTDNGCGMDRATMDRIFDPFFTTKFTGRGLGMSAVLGIVRAHGGTIEVASQPGKGTRFRILLPATKLAEVDQQPVVDVVARHPGFGQTVLVVDDEVMVRSVAQRMLEKLGCSVILAADGAQGMVCYQQHKQEITMVLLDMTMPVMDGKETLEQLRLMDASLPVFICSGYSSESVTDNFGEIQPTGYLQKPFSLKSLKALLVMSS
ncbi:MAG: PAS domain S-box protein [Mariprofundus sp.]